MVKIVILIVLALSVSGYLFSGSREVFKENVSISGVQKILVHSVSGEITVIPEDRDDIYIELESYNNGPKLYVEGGREVIIESKKRTWWSIFSFNFKSPKLKVYIPKNYNKSLFIKSISGNVYMSDMSLETLEINSTSGNTEVDKVDSSIATLKNTSGNILLENSKITNLETKVISGRIFLNDVSGNISGRSISGSVDIDLEKLEGDIRFKLTSGRFTLNVDSEEINSSIDLNTLSGRVSCDYPITVSGSMGKKRLSGISGREDFNIEVSNTSGSLYINKN